MAHTRAVAPPHSLLRPRLRAVAPAQSPLQAPAPIPVQTPVRTPAAPPADLRDRLAEVAEYLPPGATLLPAPQHTLPALPGRPPMVGYLVLLPAGPETAAAPPTAEEGPVTVDGERRVARVDGRPLDLTYLEFELLAHLVAHPHRVHSRDQLVRTVWGYGHVGDGRTVDVHVARLRRKLGAEHRHTIQTVRRVGYKYLP
ncbi:winged helix-turn-helix domain-containing protein [Streptomyces laurentii]|uniref:winged helix-turn-helix domain-containing protein n=1 Tax=Streptomyces laurentii TaxID=39478 RepID=UPI0033E970BD